MAIPRSRILDLLKVQCRIFSHTFNPQNLRLGNKVLRQRLRGPALAAYYPRKTVTFRDLKDAYKEIDPGLEIDMWDDMEEYHKEAKAFRKSRGKGPPKKKRTAAESRKFGKKK